MLFFYLALVAFIFTILMDIYRIVMIKKHSLRQRLWYLGVNMGARAIGGIFALLSLVCGVGNNYKVALVILGVDFGLLFINVLTSGILVDKMSKK